MTRSVLIERQAEVERLTRALDGVRATGEGAAVLIEAAAGLGKSALLAEASRAGRDADLNVLRARAAEGDPPLAAVRELLGPRADVGAAASGDPLAIVHELYWQLAGTVRHAAAVVAVDDAHWLDPASRRWLEFVLQRVDELPILLLVAMRPGGTEAGRALAAAAALDPAVQRLRPAALSAEGVRTMVPDPALGPAATARIHEVTAGNPLMVRTLVLALEAGELTGEDLRSPGLGRVDESRLGDLVEARVKGLGEDAVALAKGTAVLGDGCVLRDCAVVAGLELDRAGRARDALARAEVLAGGPVLRFVHPLVRASVYGRMDVTERSERHASAARQLRAVGARPDDTGMHLLRVEPAGDHHAVEMLVEGARFAFEAGAPEAAIAMLLRALEEPPPGERMAEVFERLATAGFRCGEPRTAEWATAAVERASGDVAAARTALRMATILRLQGRLGDAFAEVVPDPAAIERHDPDLALQIRAGICAAAVATPARREAARPHRAALHEAHPGPTGPGARSALALLAIEAMLANRPATEVLASARGALGDGDPAGLGGVESWPLWYAMVALVHSGAPREGLSILDRAMAGARRDASTVGVELAAVHRAYTRLMLGDVRGAEADAVESAAGTAWEIGRGAKARLAIRALTERGDLEGAMAHVELWEREPPDRGLPWYGGDRADPTWYEAMYLESRGGLELARGDAEAALRSFEAVGAALPADWVNGAFYGWRAGAARSLHALGDGAAARELATRDLALASDFGDARTIGLALRTAGVCAGGDEGLALLEQAERRLDAAGAPLERAWALFEQGVVLRRMRRKLAAREPLAAACDWASRAGARLLAARAGEELRAAGARPRREMLRGVDSLTSRERTVAELAAAGLTNPEIARQLFVTRKTVETHLGHVYGKLDVTRDGLAAALAGSPPADRAEEAV